MSKLLNSPNIPQEIAIPLNLVLFFIKASISHGQKKFIKTMVQNFLTKLFITHQQQLSNALVDRSLPCFRHPSCSSIMKYMDDPMDQERQRGTMGASSVTDCSTCKKCRTWILQDRLLKTALLLLDCPSTCPPEYILFCSLTMVHILKNCAWLCAFAALCYRNVIFVVPQWTGSLTCRNITQMSERNP